jgi:UDP-N-acetylglucosamine:LPS N-acetylglucosamine transferase
MMLPGGTSHHMQALAIARTLRGRGWRTAALMADFDAASLSQKGLLDPEVETIVFSTPPHSNDDFQARWCS